MRRDRGFALLIVLWSLVLLSLILTQLLSAGRSEAQLAANLRGAAVAEAVADGAVEEAMFHLVAGGAQGWATRGIHVLHVGRGIATVAVADFSGKVNPNTAGLPLLRALIGLCGAAPAQATILAHAIMAWRGAPVDDDGTTAATYRAAGLSYLPPGLPLQTDDELALVAGMTPPLRACLMPHVSIYQPNDPGVHADDPLVARAVAQAVQQDGFAAADPAGAPDVLRITATATVAGARFVREAVVHLLPGGAWRAGAHPDVACPVSSQTQRGFTLIEILVVIAILAGAAAILLARGPARSPALQAREAASTVSQVLRLGRSRAVAADRPVSVVLDLRTRVLSLDGAVRATLPGAVGLAAVMADGSAPRQQAAFVFAPDGSASGGRVVIGAGTRRLAVGVDWLTGRVGVDAE